MLEFSLSAAVLFLAKRAPVSLALANEFVADRRSANTTGFTFSVVNEKPLFEIAGLGVGGDEKMNQPNRIHPTAEGLKVVAENLWKVLEGQLSKWGMPQARRRRSTSASEQTSRPAVVGSGIIAAASTVAILKGS